MTWQITDGPSDEPLTTSEVKEWLKVDYDTDDTLIDGLIGAARRHAESYTGRLLMPQRVEEYFDFFEYPTLNLSFQPSTFLGVEYLDEDGATQTLSASDYTVDIISRPSRIVINPDKSWPVTGSYPNAVTVEYIAGFADAASVPDSFKTAMKLLIAFLYENREDMPLSGSNDPRVRSFHYILHPEKVLH